MRDGAALAVLLHSPLVGPATWRGVASAFEGMGVGCVVPSLLWVPTGGARYWDRVAGAVKAAVGATGHPLVLIGHSGIGPALPRIGAEFRRVAAYVFVDASLPTVGGSWLASMPVSMQERVRDGELTHVPNMWQHEATWRQVGIVDGATVAALRTEARSLPVELFGESFGGPEDWSERAPAGYLAFEPNAFYSPVVAEAQERGWTVRTLPGSHFHMVVDAPAVAEALIELLAEMGVDVRARAE